MCELCVAHVRENVEKPSSCCQCKVERKLITFSSATPVGTEIVTIALGYKDGMIKRRQER
jgi:hypothetical protein